ncbi:MAG TPA: cation:proton antiporter [Ohtaekwangia sp.]|nr:cation:proton antiporter [Ohtaekwangia sp.]
MEHYFLILLLLGVAMLGMAWMPALTSKIKVSYTIFYVGLGYILYTIFEGLPKADPLFYEYFTIHVTELVVIVSLMGTGLKIDEPFSFKEWRIPIRLVSITMILSIFTITAASMWWLDLSLASALLLGAVLAPTDPVLAEDVQVGPPLEGKKSRVRFSLTAEAGFNDGLAFPFTWLAIAFSLKEGSYTTILTNWFIFDVSYRIIAGLIIGLIGGNLIAYMIFKLPGKLLMIKKRDGFIAFSSTLLLYGLTELVSGYGFISVFVGAVTIRNYERDHHYHVILHSFIDQMEKMLMAMVLLLFGGSLVYGMLDKLTWPMAIFGLAVVLLIRPLSAFVSVVRTPLHLNEKAAISFYGIKGIGSFFYLAFAFNEAHFTSMNFLWTLVSFVVLCSLIIHGISANFVMRRISKRFEK